MSGVDRKRSYTVPCASALRDAVTVLARRRRVNVADMARSVLLMVPPEMIDAVADPGEPTHDDRETVVLKSGPAKGRPWRRKPRLQVRLPHGYAITTIRRAFGLALAVDRGELSVHVGDADKNGENQGLRPDDVKDALAREINEEVERLRTIVAVLAFEPLSGGVTSREDALHVLGFAPGSVPAAQMVKERFRMLATIHHPDSPHGNHRRMSQLNSAMEMLRII